MDGCLNKWHWVIYGFLGVAGVGSFIGCTMLMFFNDVYQSLPENMGGYGQLILMLGGCPSILMLVIIAIYIDIWENFKRYSPPDTQERFSSKTLALHLLLMYIVLMVLWFLFLRYTFGSMTYWG